LGWQTTVVARTPIPDIKVNGSDGPLTLSHGDNLTVTVSLDPASNEGEDADWWVAAYTPFDWYYYDVIGGSWSWVPGLSVTCQGPLFNLSPFEVLNISDLPEGTYTFYFGVDVNMDGSLDYDQLYYDEMEVNISGARCNFSSEPGEPERCFGGIGVCCEGIPVVAPFIKDENTCLVQGWMSVGSIFHDRCCLATNNMGYSCSSLNQGDPNLCKVEWEEAWYNTQCTALGAPRQWQYTFGPYPAGNTGDDTNKDLRAPVCARVNPQYQNLCSSGKCDTDANGNTIIKWDVCGQYCECSPCSECISIDGNWNGTASDLGDTLPITLSLSQNECYITGIIKSPESCPALCGFADNGAITGSVSGNIFSFTIANDPLVDCDTCEFICYGTDQGSLTINNNKMYGNAQVEDCEDGGYFNVTIDLTRSSSTSSLETLEKRKVDIKKSSLIRTKK